MTDTLSFPGLGFSFELRREAFTIFGFPIYWYGVIIACAFLLGAVYTLRRAKTFGLDPDRFMDGILGGVILGIIGARLFFVIFSWDTYRDDPMLIFNIRTGGLAIYGGVIGAVIGGYLVCRWRKIPFLPSLDNAAAGLLLGQGIGRWGNFTNMEAFGSNTDLPWGMTSSQIQGYLAANQSQLAAIGVEVDPMQPVHPTFFYESVWCILGFAFLAFYTKRRRYDGEMALLYLGWYGLGRFFIEGLRTDSLMVGSLRVSQILALLCVVASVVTMVLIRSRIKREQDPNFLVLHANTLDGQAMADGSYYRRPPARDTAEAETDTDETPLLPEEEPVAEQPEGDAPSTETAEEEKNDGQAD